MLSLCTVELSFGFVHRAPSFFFFFFNDTATTEIYTLSLHDALPISLRLGKPPRDREPEAGASGVRRRGRAAEKRREDALAVFGRDAGAPIPHGKQRSEEHTSELQSRPHLVCRLLLEKKKNTEVHPIS